MMFKAAFVCRLPLASRRLYAMLLCLLIAGATLNAQTSVSIHDIMTTTGNYPLPNSPYLYSHYGQAVSVTGVVVGVMSTGGFYISEPSNDWDSLVATAEGMPVFAMAGNNPSCAVVGNLVAVVGDVVNSTAVNAADTPGTGIQPTSCTVTATNQTMTQAISISAALSTFGGALEYTGMSANNSSFYAVSPTGGTTTAGVTTSSGQFWATLSSNSATNNHLFRSAGIAGDEYVPTGAPSTVATWSGNPQRILIDTATFGGTPVNITVGQSITCTVPSGITAGATAGIGLIDYTLGYARLLIFPTSKCTVGGTVAPTTTATSDATHFAVGTLDLNGLSASSTNFATALTKSTLAIKSVEGAPDIIALQEVQDSTTLTTLATATNTAIGTGTYQSVFSAATSSTDSGLGFLYNTSKITLNSSTQIGVGDTYTTPSGTAAALWEKPPLVINVGVSRVGRNYVAIVIDTWMTPRTNIGDATLGATVRAHRAAQAYALSEYIQQLQTAGANVLVLGDFNAYQFSDGYVDVMGVIGGAPAAATAVTLYQAAATTQALTNFTTDVTTLQRYNIIENGNAAATEHILASAVAYDSTSASEPLASYETSVVQPHFTADFADIDANDATTPAGLTPHDGEVVYFLIPALPTLASISPTSINFGTVELGASSATQTVTVTNTSGFSSTVNVTTVAISGTNAADFTQTSNCTSLADGATCTVTLTFTPTAIGSRTATLTVTTDSTSEPTLTVSLAGTSINTTATLTPASSTFPDTGLTVTSAAQIFTYTNTSSTVTETIGTVTITGDYAIASNTCAAGASIAPGKTCVITVTFTPTATGTRSGTLTVTDSSTGNSTLTSTLTGNGLPTTATLTPSSASFGNVYAGGGHSVAQVFTLTNTSPDSISIAVKSITLSSSVFTETSTCGTTLAAGASCTISVIFSPMAAGAQTATLTVTNGSSANPTLTATLTGTGLPTTATLSPTRATYPNTIVGSNSASQTFVWTNTSAIALTINSVAVAGNFSVSSTTCSGQIAANSSCIINVIFTPQALGALTGTLTVTSTSSANGTLTATISGRGVADVEANVSALNFGNVDLGSSATPQTFTVTNYTNAAIALTSIVLSGTDYIESTTCGSSLAGQATCTFTVGFTPTAVGTRIGSIIINTNDTKYPVITVALTGNGVDFSVALNPSSGSLIAGFYTNSVQLTVTPLGGFNSQVVIGCTTNASGSVCTPGVTTTTLTAAVTTPVYISTTSQYTPIGYSAGSLGTNRWLAPLAAFSGGLLFFTMRRRRGLLRLLGVLLVTLAASFGVSGCGSTPPKNESPTLPGTYTYTFSATDGVVTRTRTYKLTVTVD